MRITAQVMVALECPDTVDISLVRKALQDEIKMFVPTAHLADVTRVHVQRIDAQDADS
jgi:hypothetical protein